MSEPVQKWISSLDWEIRVDLGHGDRDVYFIHEQDDHSVGMFGSQISPEFYSIDQLELWCKNMMESYKIEFK